MLLPAKVNSYPILLWILGFPRGYRPQVGQAISRAAIALNFPRPDVAAPFFQGCIRSSLICWLRLFPRPIFRSSYPLLR